MKDIYIIIIAVTIAISLYFVFDKLFTFKFNEGFETTQFSRVEGIYPVSVDKAILEDYPHIGKNEVSTESASNMWWTYPVFSLASFKQQTNNLRYRNNPDEGTCTRPEFCGALYRNKKNKSNEIEPLPPAEEGPGARVGYFRTEPNILPYSIPTNENILY